jgi:predicted nucleotidyltransferase/DNA-binding XRE family transcriptional regulator
VDDEVDVAILVRRAREDARLSQRDLARRAGVQQPNLAAIESGTRGPGKELLERILRAAELRPSIPLELNADRIRRLAPSYGLSDVRVFGSTVHGTDNSASDVDLLVRARADVDYLALAAFRQQVADILGFPVDTVIDVPESPDVAAISADAVPL